MVAVEIFEPTAEWGVVLLELGGAVFDVDAAAAIDEGLTSVDSTFATDEA